MDQIDTAVRETGAWVDGFAVRLQPRAVNSSARYSPGGNISAARGSQDQARALTSIVVVANPYRGDGGRYRPGRCRLAFQA